MLFYGKLMKGELIFLILTEISSYPCEVFYFTDLIIFSISLVDDIYILYLQMGQ